MTRRIAITIFAFLLGLVAIDQLSGLALRAVFARTMTGDAGGMVNHALANADADVIVFGTSRAAHHVDSLALSEQLGVDVYNAGVDGQRIFYARMLQALLLAEGTNAQLFVLQAETRGLFKPEPERALVMTPFAHRSADLLEVLERIDPKVRIKLLSATYPFNSKLPSMLRNVGREPPRDQFEVLHGTMDGPPVDALEFEADLSVEPPYPLDPFAADMYREFVAEAHAAGIPVFMFGGPRYREGGEGPAYSVAIAFFDALANEYDNVVFLPLNDETHPELVRADWFRDRDHLNAEGAAAFTVLLGEEIARSGLLDVE